MKNSCEIERADHDRSSDLLRIARVVEIGEKELVRLNQLNLLLMNRERLNAVFVLVKSKGVD